MKAAAAAMFDACLMTAGALNELGIAPEISLDASAFKMLTDAFRDEDPDMLHPDFDRRVRRQWFFDVNGLRIWCAR